MSTTKLTTAVLAAAIGVAACGDDSSYNNGPAFDPSQPARNATAAIVHQDTANNATLLNQLQKLDPSIRAVDPVLEDGRKTLNISRDLGDGKMSIWTMAPDDYDKLMATPADQSATASTTQSAKDNGFSGGEMLMGAGAGILAGALLGSMLSNSNPSRVSSFNSPSAYNSYRSATTGEYRSAVHRDKLQEEERRRRPGGGAIGSNVAAQMMLNQAASNSASSSASSAASAAAVNRNAAAATSVNRSPNFAPPANPAMASSGVSAARSVNTAPGMASSSYASRSATTSQAFSSASSGRGASVGSSST